MSSFNLRIDKNTFTLKSKGSIANYAKILINKSKNVTISFRIVVINSRSFILNTFLRLFRFTPKAATLGVATSSKILLFLILIFNTAKADDTIGNDNKLEFEPQTSKLENGIFVKNDYIVSTDICKFSCRSVQSDYIATITDIDASSGTTYCEVKNKYGTKLNVNANQINTKCREDANAYYNGDLVSGNIYNDFKESIYDSTKITFSKFLASLATLDPEVIDFHNTSLSGILTLKDPNAVYGTRAVLNTDFFSLITGKQDNLELLSSADSINKANLGYYANLFSDMQKIYSFLQNFLFMMIGAFFLFKLGSVKLLDYLQNYSTESKDYLKKFAIPVVSVAIFFAPIPESSGMNTTIVQSLIRYFTQTSISIADRASAIGANTYLRYLYNSVGFQAMEGELAIKNQLTQAIAQEAQYKSVIEFCKEAYPNKLAYGGNKYLNDIESSNAFDLNAKASVIDENACAKVQYKYLSTQKQRRVLANYVDTINNNWQNNSELKSLLSKVNTEMNSRQNELGWANALIIPSTALMIDILSVVDTSRDKLENTEENNEKIITEANQNSDTSLTKISGTIMAKLLGGTPYFILPGASGIYNFIHDNLDKLEGDKVSNFLSKWVKNTLFIGYISTASSIIGGLLASPIAYITTWSIMKTILEFLPLLTAMICGIIVFIGFIVDLAFYFYISPFVVAYSLTQKNTHKIIEFLVKGMQLFFKPIVLVILIFFALAMNHLVNDVFIGFATIQFASLSAINNEFSTAVALGLIQSTIGILGVIASIYITWRIIIYGVGIVYEHIGLKDTNSTIADLTQKLEKYSVQV
ncbi:hypothetical protein [Helicobacter sp. MIT 14-3879]|uniref:hypothetical protein n=1 Tax=Helicobacter sp. MIT 14-3879 TaxID=2040649 RepID=UPI000E1F795D|nr:hypothetical protein [Helicobacter sp. MIT 14-3879]RDU61841.1 hypothetical protein CQA44_07900 [Helicobacter sp. MIT 14-3879]